VRKKLTKKFQKQLRLIQNSELDNMDLKRGTVQSCSDFGSRACVVSTVGREAQVLEIQDHRELTNDDEITSISNLQIGAHTHFLQIRALPNLIYLEDDCLLRSCTVKSRRNWPTFQRCLLPQGSLMMEAVNTSEASVSIYQTTRRNFPEDSHFHTRRSENLKSHSCSFIVLSYKILAYRVISFSLLFSPLYCKNYLCPPLFRYLATVSVHKVITMKRHGGKYK
jgi:hypothetical protein